MAAKSKTTEGFTADERAAMKERAKEVRTTARRSAATKKADGESDVLAKIAEMPPADRELAECIHAIVKEVAPGLSSKTWYGMPAYANDDGKIVCFFQPADKFKARYSTLGFNDVATLDDGTMWPTAFALTKLKKADETRIGTLIRRAAGLEG